MSLSAWASSAVVLAADQEPKGPEFGKASPLGLLIIIVLLVAVFLLIRSMNRQLKKLPESFDTDHPEADQAFDEGTERQRPMNRTRRDRVEIGCRGIVVGAFVAERRRSTRDDDDG